MDVTPVGRVHQDRAVGRGRVGGLWLALASLVFMVPAPLMAQAELDTLRVDSLMAVATDRVQSAAIAAAREDADAIHDDWINLFGYGGVFAEVLGELSAAGCDIGWLASDLFWLADALSLAGERSSDGEMDQWPQGPEFILELLEDVQETLRQISCTGRDESGSARVRSAVSIGFRVARTIN